LLHARKLHHVQLLEVEGGYDTSTGWR
jgi:hypothetical protein